MSNILTRFFKGLILRGESSDISDNIEGSVFHNSSDSRLKTYIEGAVRQILTNSQSQTLTNKTINVSSNTVVTTAVGNLSSTELNAALNELQLDIDTRVAGPVSSVDTQIARFDGTTGKVIDAVSGTTLSDAGIITSNQLIANQALVANQVLALQGSAADTSTGSNVLLASNTYARLRLTGSGLVSVGGIASPTSGRLFVLSNETGADVTIIHNDSTIATASNRFYTPDGSNFTFKNNSMIWYMYTSTIDRHVIISGGGGGGGSVVSTTIDTFNGDNSTVTFTLSINPLSKDNTQVYVNGVYQNKATYSVTSTSLQFTEAPPTGTGNIEVKMLSLSAVGSLPDATSSVKGVVKLAGDLGGTADLPRVSKYVEILNCPIILGNSNLSSLLGLTYFRVPTSLPITVTGVEIQIFTKGSSTTGNLELDVLRSNNLEGAGAGYASIMTTKPIIDIATALDYDASIGTIDPSLSSLNAGIFLRVDLTQIPANLTALHVRVYGFSN
jgi:hypothetical protein